MIEGGKLGLAAAVALAVMAAPGWAAECNAEIQRVQAQATKVTDAKLKRLVDYDITRAKKESGESDATECQEAIDHADKLLGAPTP